MTNLLIGWTNHIKTASSLTASGSATGLGADQLANDQGASSTALQTPATFTAVTITCDMGASVTWRLLGFFRTNMSSGATVRWRLGDDATFATNTVDTGTISADMADGYGQHVHVLDDDTAARYLRVIVGDSTAGLDFLNLPLMFAGPAWQPDYNWSPESAETAIIEAPAPTTRGGQVFPEFRWRARRRLVSLPLVTRTERWPQLGELERHAARGGNVLVVPNEAGDLGREPVFGRVEFDAVGYAAASPYRFRGTRFTVTERL